MESTIQDLRMIMGLQHWISISNQANTSSAANIIISKTTITFLFLIDAKTIFKCINKNLYIIMEFLSNEKQ